MENDNIMLDHSSFKMNGNFECPSKMNDIIQEFTKLYTEKLERIDDKESEKELKRKVAVLEAWVRDLGEQNGVLVSTVEDLEREAAHRVSLLQDRLDKMALATRESCVALRDHQGQMTSLVTQKLSAERDLKCLREKVSDLEEANGSLLQDNSDLRQDLDNIIEVISSSRLTGRWDYSHMTFKSIRPDQVLGSYCSFRNGSPSAARDQTADLETHDSLTSDLQWLEGEEKCVPKLKLEIQSLKNIQRETNFLLTQRDEHIADLQSQLTELHHKMAAAQAQVNNTTSTLHNLMDRGRHDSFEICRRDDVIRQLLSPTCNSKSIEQTDFKSKLDVELELSENIDVLALRLSDLEEECQRLRHQNEEYRNAQGSATHSGPLGEAGADDTQNCSKSEKHLSCDLPSRVTSSQQTQTEDWLKETGSTRNAATSPDPLRTRLAREEDLQQLSKLENELAEKNVLLRELQNHLEVAREEVRLKDQALYNMEQKLDASRRGYDEKEERLLYLTSQLTSLQLEVSRLHGNGQHLRLQLDKKNHLILKLEAETDSLTRQLNEKSASLEGLQKDLSVLRGELERKKKEIADQRITIGTLQDALIASKISCDKLRAQLDAQSGSNNAFNNSLPLLLHRKDILSLQSESLEDPQLHLSTILPDIRPLNTHPPPLSTTCPDVVSFLTHKNGEVTSDLPRETDPDTFEPMSLPSYHLQNGVRNSSMSTLQDSRPPQSLTLNLSESLSSLEKGCSVNSKSLLMLSPSDSGIGSEDYISPSSRSPSKSNGRKNFGEIFQV